MRLKFFTNEVVGKKRGCSEVSRMVERGMTDKGFYAVYVTHPVVKHYVLSSRSEIYQSLKGRERERFCLTLIISYPFSFRRVLLKPSS